MTTPTDLGSLCAELVHALDINDYYDVYSDRMFHENLLERARAALAQTPAESDKPTSQELFNLWKACNSPSVFARRVLERWGNPAPVPPAHGELTDQELLRLYKVGTPCYAVEEYRRELDAMRAAIAADRARLAPPADGELGS